MSKRHAFEMLGDLRLDLLAGQIFANLPRTRSSATRQPESLTPWVLSTWERRVGALAIGCAPRVTARWDELRSPYTGV